MMSSAADPSPYTTVAQRKIQGMGRLQSHFANAGDGNNPNAWEQLWKDEFSPWDRGQASPALYDLLMERQDLIKTPWQTVAESGARRRKRALVPGCGRGYDVLLLAQFGYDVVGLDGAETAVREATKLARTTFDDLKAQNSNTDKGSVEFVVGDFFSPGWQQHKLDAAESERFDLIYDYTFFCALPRSVRPAWAKRMTELLAEDGQLVCLEHPLHKPPTEAGPPFGVDEKVYEQHLSWPGDDLDYDVEGCIVHRSGKGPYGLLRLDRWAPKRTHKAGENSDHMSVWYHFKR